MASQNLNVGTAANANDGDTLRAAFIKVKQMFAEVYGQTYSEQGDLSGDEFKIKGDKLQMTADAVAGDDGKVLTYDHASGGFTWETKFDGDITSIIAGEGLTGSDLDSGDATLNLDSSIAGSGLTYTSGVLSVDSIDTADITDDAVTPAKTSLFADAAVGTTQHQVLVSNGTAFTNVTMSGDATMSSTGVLSLSIDAVNNSEIADNAVDGAKIADDAVDHDQLADRYTAKATSSTAVSQNLDASAASTFLLTGNITTATLTIQNMKLGQSIDIVLSGTLTSAVITLADDFTTSTISKVGGTDLDTAETNIIQVICLDDTDSAAKLVYSINKYETDTTP